MRKIVLIVEPEAHLREALVESLAPFDSEILPVAVADRGAAARVLEEHRVDLLVADLGCSLMDGFVTARQLLQLTPDVPVLALAREAAPQLSEDLGVALRLLPKPIDLTRFRDSVLLQLERAPRGHLSGVSIVGFLQLMEAEERSGVLVVDTQGGGGRLVVCDGELVDAESTGKRGEEAVFHIVQTLEESGGEIWVEKLVEPVHRTIQARLGWLLLEAARRRDEQLHPPLAAEGGEPRDGG